MRKVTVDGQQIDVAKGAAVRKACEIVVKGIPGFVLALRGGWLKLHALSFTALVFAGPAVAQDLESDGRLDRFLSPDSQIGTRFKQAPETASAADGRQMQKRIAKCVYYGKKEELNTLLANSDFDQIDFEKTGFDRSDFFDQINFGRCLERAMKASQYKIYMRIQYSTLRNLIAEEAYLYATKDAPTRAEGAPTKIGQRFAVKQGGVRAEVLAEVSDCVSYRNPALAHDFLETTPGTSKETDAFEALAPTLVTCLEADSMPNVNTSMVRQIVADGMWARNYYGAFSASEQIEAEDDSDA